MKILTCGLKVKNFVKAKNEKSSRSGGYCLSCNDIVYKDQQIKD